MLCVLVTVVPTYCSDVAKILSTYPPLAGLPDQLVTASLAAHAIAAGPALHATYGAVTAYCTNVGVGGGVPPLKNSPSNPLMVTIG